MNACTKPLPFRRPASLHRQSLLIELGYCTERDIQEGLAGQAGMAFVDLSKFTVSDEVRDSISSETAQAYQVVPIEFNPKTKKIKIAMKSPDNFRAVDDIRLLLGRRGRRRRRRRHRLLAQEELLQERVDHRRRLRPRE